jgi:hypothetical protein
LRLGGEGSVTVETSLNSSSVSTLLSSKSQAIEPGAAFGAWVITAFDSLGKRAFVRCACGAARLLSVEAIRDGVAPLGCGCAATPSVQIRDARADRWRKPDWRLRQ